MASQAVNPFSGRLQLSGGSSSVASGTTPITGGTVGALLFQGSGNVVQQDASNLLWDDTNNILGIGNAATLNVTQRAKQATDFLILGSSAAENATLRANIRFSGSGYAAPSNSGAESNGDKFVFYNNNTIKTAFGFDTGPVVWFQTQGNANAAFRWYVNSTNFTSLKMTLDSAGLLTLANATMLATSVSYTNGAAAATGTLTNAPSAGNPTKWIPVNDNGTTRYIPAW